MKRIIYSDGENVSSFPFPGSNPVEYDLDDLHSRIALCKATSISLDMSYEERLRLLKIRYGV